MRPTRDQMLMEMAEVMAKRGTCSRAKVGAVFSIGGRIIITGYNGVPAGMAHCQHLHDEGVMAHSEIPGDYAYEPSNNGCKEAVHAEANAISYAARFGISISGTDLFTTLSPCPACSMLLINAGVVRVVYLNEYRDNTGLLLLNRANIITENFRMIEDFG